MPEPTDYTLAYDIDEGSGATLTNKGSVGSAGNLTISPAPGSGGPTWQTGPGSGLDANVLRWTGPASEQVASVSGLTDPGGTTTGTLAIRCTIIESTTLDRYIFLGFGRHGVSHWEIYRFDADVWVGTAAPGFDEVEGNNTATTFDDGNLHWVVGVADGTEYQLWVDGTLIASGGSGDIPAGVDLTFFGIGYDNDNGVSGGLAMAGDVAAVRVYDRPLSPAEIAELGETATTVEVAASHGLVIGHSATADATVTAEASHGLTLDHAVTVDIESFIVTADVSHGLLLDHAVTANIDQSPVEGLLAAWALDEGGGTEYVEWTGVHPDATSVGGTPPQGITGQYGNALRFVEAAPPNDMRVSAPLSGGPYPLADGYTLTFWLNTAVATENQNAINTSGSFGDILSIQPWGDGSLYVVHNGVEVGYAGGYATDEWEFFAVVWDPVADTLTGYRGDGDTVATAFGSAAAAAALTTAVSSLTFGGPTGSSNRLFNAGLDEIWLFDRPLSPAEVDTIRQTPLGGMVTPTVTADVSHALVIGHAATVDVGIDTITADVSHGLELGHQVEAIVPSEGFEVGEGVNVVPVSNCTQLQNAINNASPGDKILLADGIYNCSIFIEGIFGDGDQGLTIEADNWGSVAWANGQGARITGPATWWVDNAENVTIRGLWHHGDPTPSAPNAFHVQTNSSYVRITACDIEMDNSDATGAGDAYENDYVFIEGTNTHHVAVDHCAMRGKRTEGAYIYTRMDDLNTESIKYPWIHHNEFRDFLGPEDLNYEPLRIGHCDAATSESFALIEYNWLENLEADNEVISSKVSRQTFRYNVFRNCRGALDLRCGNNAEVYGNVFIQSETVGAPGMGGITVDEGAGHRIWNNYFQDLTSDAANRPGGIILEVNQSGEGALRVADAQVFNNTLVGVRRPLQIGRDRTASHDQQPTDALVVNNLVDVDTTRPAVSTGTGATATYDQNILHNTGAGGTGGVDPDPITADPGLALADGLYRWMAGSVAEGAANAAFQPGDDLEGRSRPTPGAIGALEIVGTVTRPLLTLDDVGPDAIQVTPEVGVAVSHGLVVGHAVEAEVLASVTADASHGLVLSHRVTAETSDAPKPPLPPSSFADCCASMLELRLGNEWQNITNSAYWRDAVEIDHGRRRERGRYSAISDPSSATATLRDPDGRYSERNPLGPYYNELGRNVPLRVSVHGGEPYLSLPEVEEEPSTNFAITPDHASIDVTGDVDIRVEATGLWRPDTSRGLVRKWTSTGNQRSWTAWIVGRNDPGGSPKGAIRFQWSPNGSTVLEATSTMPVERQAGRQAVRVTLDVNNGTGGRTVRFFTADAIGTDEWMEVGEPVVQSGTTSIFNSTTRIELGRVQPGISSWQGRIHAFELRAGIDGALRTSPNFGDVEVGATVFEDEQGREWTIEGDAEVSQRRVRFVGEVAEWPQDWDDTEQVVRVPIEAAGVLRRYGQGALPIESALRQALEDAPQLLAYWPCEDAPGSRKIASAIPGTPMAVSGNPNFASFSGFAASAPILTLNGAQLTGPVTQSRNSSRLQVRWLMHVPAGTEGIQTIMLVNTNGLDYYVEYAGAGALRLVIRKTNNDVEFVNTYANYAVDDKLLRVGLSLFQVGNNLQWRLNTMTTGGQAISHSAILTGRRVHKLQSLVVSPSGGLRDVAIGHITAQTTYSTLQDFASELAGYAGETAGRRIERLCKQHGVAFVAHGDLDETVRMGPQRVDTFLNLIYEAAEADMGLLFEPRDRLGLAYRPRSSLYNQREKITVDCCSGELGDALKPTFDDQYTRNDVEVSREDGSSARVALEEGRLSINPPPDGVGQYPDSVTVNVESDEQLPDQAGWRLHLGTVDEPRFPDVIFKLLAPIIRTNPRLLADILDLEVGDRVKVTNPPVRMGLDAVDVVMQGTTEAFSDFSDLAYRLGMDCTPGSPWDVGVYSGGESDPMHEPARYDTNGSQLAAGLSAAATVFGVHVIRGPRWTTDPVEIGAGIPIVVGGEEMRVTAVSSGTIFNPAIGSADASTVSSTSHVAPSVTPQSSVSRLIGAWCSSGDPGDYTVPGTMTPGIETDGIESTMRTATQALASGAATGTRTATFAPSSPWSALLVAVHGSGAAPVVQEEVAGVSSSATQEADDVVLTTSETTQKHWWLLAIQAWDQDPSGSMAMPNDSHAWEPIVLSQLQSAGTSRVSAWIRQVDVSGEQEVTFLGTPQLFDNHARLLVISGVVVGSQQFTVVRAVNGVVKPHSATSDVRLARPTRYSL